MNVISRFRFNAPTFRAHHREIFLRGVVSFCRRTRHKAYAARCPLHLLRYVISRVARPRKITRDQEKGIYGTGIRWIAGKVQHIFDGHWLLTQRRTETLRRKFDFHFLRDDIDVVRRRRGILNDSFRLRFERSLSRIRDPPIFIFRSRCYFQRTKRIVYDLRTFLAENWNESWISAMIRSNVL